MSLSNSVPLWERKAFQEALLFAQTQDLTVGDHLDTWINMVEHPTDSWEQLSSLHAIYLYQSKQGRRLTEMNFKDYLGWLIDKGFHEDEKDKDKVTKMEEAEKELNRIQPKDWSWELVFHFLGVFTAKELDFVGL
jgi:hypothetical protein